jgi:hypothetical protein
MLMKLGYRPDEAATMLGSEQLLNECVAAGWIKPVMQRHKLTLYDGGALAKCWARILAGEVPPPLPRKKTTDKEVLAHA